MNRPDFTDFFCFSNPWKTIGDYLRLDFRLTGAGTDARIRFNFIRNQGVYGI